MPRSPFAAIREELHRSAAVPGIVGFANADEAGAETMRSLDLTLGFGDGGNPDAARRSAPPGKLWKRVQRSFGGTEMVDEIAKGRRSDIVAANEPEPGDPLAVRQRNPFSSCAV